MLASSNSMADENIRIHGVISDHSIGIHIIYERPISIKLHEVAQNTEHTDAHEGRPKTEETRVRPL